MTACHRNHEPARGPFASPHVPTLAPRALPLMEATPNPHYLRELHRVRGIAGTPSLARTVPLRAPRLD